MSDINDHELRISLCALGFDVGPVTDTTRDVYRRKYLRYKDMKTKSIPNQEMVSDNFKFVRTSTKNQDISSNSEDLENSPIISPIYPNLFELSKDEIGGNSYVVAQDLSKVDDRELYSPDNVDDLFDDDLDEDLKKMQDYDDDGDDVDDDDDTSYEVYEESKISEINSTNRTFNIDSVASSYTGRNSEITCRPPLPTYLHRLEALGYDPSDMEQILISNDFTKLRNRSKTNPVHSHPELPRQTFESQDDSDADGGVIRGGKDGLNGGINGHVSKGLGDRKEEAGNGAFCRFEMLRVVCFCTVLLVLVLLVYCHMEEQLQRIN